MNWNQPQCERCWIAGNAAYKGGKLETILQPVRLVEPVVERCAWCGMPTIFGVYVRANPAEVEYPAEEPDEEPAEN